MASRQTVRRRNDIPKRLWNKKNTRLCPMPLAAVYFFALFAIENGDIRISKHWCLVTLYIAHPHSVRNYAPSSQKSH